MAKTTNRPKTKPAEKIKMSLNISIIIISSESFSFVDLRTREFDGNFFFKTKTKLSCTHALKYGIESGLTTDFSRTDI